MTLIVQNFVFASKEFNQLATWLKILFQRKIQRKVFCFEFLAFFAKYYSYQKMSNVYGHFCDQCGSFDTHIDIVYDIICHMTYAINVIKWHFMTYVIWHKMSYTMSIWVYEEPNWSHKLTLNVWHLLVERKVCEKMQRNWNTIFFFVFSFGIFCGSLFLIATGLVNLQLWNSTKLQILDILLIRVVFPDSAPPITTTFNFLIGSSSLQSRS